MGLKDPAFVDKVTRNYLNYFIYTQRDFEFTKGFSYSKIKTSDKEKYNFFDETPNIYLLGLSQQIKKEVKEKIKDIEKVPILLNYCNIENSHVYKPVATYNAYEYDLNIAFTTILRKLYITDTTYNKMLKYKYENGWNVNQSIGMALLGESAKATYKKGIKQDMQLRLNPLRGIFYMLRYLTINSIKFLLQNYAKQRISFFVDAFMLSQKNNINYLAKEFEWSFLESLSKLNDNLKKYENFELKELVDFNKLNDLAFSLKEKPITNLIFEKDKFTGKNILIFNREGNIITYK